MNYILRTSDAHMWLRDVYQIIPTSDDVAIVTYADGRTETIPDVKWYSVLHHAFRRIPQVFN